MDINLKMPDHSFLGFEIIYLESLLGERSLDEDEPQRKLINTINPFNPTC